MTREEGLQKKRDYAKQYRKDNLEEVRLKDAERRVKRAAYMKAYFKDYAPKWRKKNPDKAAAAVARYHESHKEERRAYMKTYGSANKEKTRARSNARHRRLRQATPAWADRAKILSVYKWAKMTSEITGESWQVDHIIPLKGKIICGLHVETNLRILPAVLNAKKRNNMLAPGEPEHLLIRRLD